MLQLKNTSPFAADLSVFANETAVDTLYVAVKATFELGSRLSVADEQIELIKADEYWGEPAESSLKYASEKVSIFTSADVDPQVLRTRPLFWTAKIGTRLGPASLPVLGEKPLTVEAVDGALLNEDSPAEAVIYVDTEGAAKLRGMTILGKLVRTGSIAILLRPDAE